MSTIDIDAVYDAFCSGLPEHTQRVGRALAFQLGLAPDLGVPWGNVFKHDVTLRAPAFFVEGRENVDGGLLERAVLAHMLAVIEAFASDRVADGQAVQTRELTYLLVAMREARDDALAAIAGTGFRAAARAADSRTRGAIETERALLFDGAPVSVERYIDISREKQAVGLTASVALATSLGWPSSAVSAVETTLLGVALGLQVHDDVVDWKEDAARGGAWAIVLARAVSSGEASAGNPSEHLVLSSGIAGKMLDLARLEYAKAADGAEALGAHRLAEWARARAAEAEEQRDGERRSPGYVARLRQLGAWKAQIFA